MKNIMARVHETSFSFSRRHFQQIIKKVTRETTASSSREEEEEVGAGDEHLMNYTKLKYSISSSSDEKGKNKTPSNMAKLRTAFSSAMGIGRRSKPRSAKMVGTLFGHRRGHVHFAFQTDPRSPPAILIQLAMPTANLVREMASGLVRIALECQLGDSDRPKQRLLEEKQWKAYCNGKKCGFAIRKECGESEVRVLRAVEPVTVGAGVLSPESGTHHEEEEEVGEMMYMRARFERVTGSRDSEAFYMMNPDGNWSSGPELSIYLLRV